MGDIPMYANSVCENDGEIEISASMTKKSVAESIAMRVKKAASCVLGWEGCGVVEGGVMEFMV